MSVLTEAASLATSERDMKLDALRERLNGAVAALVTGEDWKRAIEYAARFRSRSLRNAWLIWAQHAAAYEAGETDAPTPTYVAGFKQWKALGRSVMKGKRGYQIFAPHTALFASATPSNPSSWHRLPKGARPAPGEQVRSQMVGSHVAYVWDVSATQGDALPVRPEPRLPHGEAPAGLWDGIAAQIEAQGFRLLSAANAAEIGGANGVTNYTARTVHVRADMAEAARARCAAHELAHVLDGPASATDAARHRGIAEVTAESVSLMVAASHGLATDDYAVPYVAGWAGTVPGRDPLDVVRSTAERVRALAVQILDNLDTTQIGNGQPTHREHAPA